MKKTIILLIVSITLFSLTTNAQIVFQNSDSVVNYLKGSWTWNNSCGGVTGNYCRTPANIGFSQAIVFSRIPGVNDSLSYVFYKNGNAVESHGTKVTYNTVTGFGSSWMIMIKAMGSQLLSLNKKSGDTTVITDVCWDCFAHRFYRDVTVGIGKYVLDNTQISIFPIPATEKIQINLKNSDNIEGIVIYDVNGSQALIPSPDSEFIEVSSLPKGVYFIQISTKTKRYQAKFLKN